MVNIQIAKFRLEQVGSKSIFSPPCMENLYLFHLKYYGNKFRKYVSMSRKSGVCVLRPPSAKHAAGATKDMFEEVWHHVGFTHVHTDRSARVLNRVKEKSKTKLTHFIPQGFLERCLNVLYTKDVSSLTKDVSLHPDQVCYLDLFLKSTYPRSKMNSISNTSASQVPVMKEPFNWKHACY